MAATMYASVQGRIIDADNRIFLATTQRNRLVNSDEFQNALRYCSTGGGWDQYEACCAKLDAYDLVIAKAEQDKAVWNALVNL